MRPRNGCKTYRQQLYERLVRKIVFGEYPAGCELPSMGQVAEQHGVSRSLVKQVFGDLAREGMILNRNGQPALVRPPSNDRQELVMVALRNLNFEYGDGPWGWQVLQAVSRELLSANIPQVNIPFERMKDEMWRNLSSGIILFHDHIFQEGRTLAQEWGKPYVSLRAFVNEPGPNTVYVSYRGAAEQIACYFLSGGVKSVVNIVTGQRLHEKLSAVDPCHRFHDTFRMLTASGNVSPDKIVFLRSPGIFVDPGPEVEKLLEHLPRPIGVLTDSDYISSKLALMAIRMKLRLKKDIMIVGGSGLPEAGDWSPALTSCRIPFDELAGSAVRILAEQWKRGVNIVGPVGVPTSLTIRET